MPWTHNHRRWSRITLAISFRILLVTGLFTVMAFSLGLILGVLVVAVRFVASGSPDYSIAYRLVALPAGFIGMLVGLLVMLVAEVRKLRRPAVSTAMRSESQP